jgi:hypothetical protein
VADTPGPGTQRQSLGSTNGGESTMPSFSPDLIQIMRAALDEVMTKVPAEQATPGLKARMAEIILKAAAEGQTTYEGLLAAASDQIQKALSMLM